MPKTLYEGYRVGANGGERWSGTVARVTTVEPSATVEVTTDRPERDTAAQAGDRDIADRMMPFGGSAFSRGMVQRKDD